MNKASLHWSRRDFIKFAGASAAAAAFSSSPQSLLADQANPARPNVLIVFPDQWRRQALACNGDPVVRTPNLDKFCASAMSFDRCYATNPLCTPARAVFQSSRYPHQTGMIHNDLFLPNLETSMGHVFKNAGYETGYIGKWHIGGEEKPGFVAPPFRQGYTYFEGFNRGHYYGPSKPQWFTPEGKFIKEAAGFESEIQADMALKFMKQKAQTPEKPFMLFLSWGPPHQPYAPPKEYRLYKPNDLKWRDNVPESYRRKKVGQHWLCGYYGLCEALDHQMGRLMAYLDESGLAGNTIVVFVSDHGDSHGSHNLIYKTHPEEESLGIPLMVRYPGTIAAGTRTQTLASTIDFAPTLISLAGLKIPDTMHGRDLSPVLKGKSVSADFVYCASRMKASTPDNDTGDEGESKPVAGSDGKEWRGIVTDRYKLALNITGEVHRLSDLREDPLEMKNLKDDPGAKGIRDELLAQLRDYGKKTGDPFPQRCNAAGSFPKA